MSGSTDDYEAEMDRLMKIRFRKLQEQIDKGEESFAYSYNRDSDASTVKSKFSSAGHEPSTESVRLAGRIMVVRDHGKSCFMNLKDRSGTIQLYGRLDIMGADEYGKFSVIDAGDIIGVEGNVFKTKKGEITVQVKSFKQLAKSLRPLPEKYHGLKDIETRYRMRYVDLAVNDNVMSNFILRAKFISLVRKWLDDRGYIEVETPILTSIPSGALAKPFITHYNYLDQDFYLRIATELYLKRLIVGGMEKVYEIGKDFRNEDMDTTHNPEFTMLELYEAYTDYGDMMRLTESLVSDCIYSLMGTHEIEYDGKRLNFAPPWRRLTMLDAIRDVGEIDIKDPADANELLRIAKELRLEKLKDDMSAGELIAEIYDQRVEGKMIQPTLVSEYPVEISPLAKRKRGNPAFAERFEGFVNGFEIANAFSELNSPLEQKANFEAQMARRAKGDEEAHPFDEDYITALEYGLPPTGGLGVGLDRIVMLLTNSSSIKDVMLFPQLKRKEQPPTKE